MQAEGVSSFNKMGFTKIYAYIEGGIKVVLDGQNHHPMMLFFEDVKVFDFPKLNCAYLVGIPKLSSMRAHLEEIPGVTVFDSPHSPHPIKAQHHKLVAKHGVLPTDTMWFAIEKIRDDLKLHGTIFDPHI